MTRADAFFTFAALALTAAALEGCNIVGGSCETTVPASCPSTVRGDVEQELATCAMPPYGGMSAADITTVLTWIECGAPDN